MLLVPVLTGLNCSEKLMALITEEISFCISSMGNNLNRMLRIVQHTSKSDLLAIVGFGGNFIFQHPLRWREYFPQKYL
jgi:hypothetical protein